MWSTLIFRRGIGVCCFLLLLLAACAPEKETDVPATAGASPAETTTISTVTTPAAATAEASPFPEPSPTAVTTATVAATEPATATPVPAFAPVFVPTPAATLPADLPVIAPENAAGLTQLTHFGNGRIATIAWSADGTTFAVGGSTGIHLYDADTLQELRTFGAGEEGAIYDARLSPQGDVLALLRCNQGACFVELWQSASGQLIRTLSDASGLPVFTPDGQTIVLLQSPLVWQDVHTGETQRTVQLEFQKSSWVILSPSEDMLAEDPWPADGERHTVVVSSTVSVAFSPTCNTLPRPAHCVAVPPTSSLAFSPQSDLLAGAYINVVHLSDVQSGQLLHVLEGHTGSVDNIVFSPDGRILATGSGDDRTVRLWDTATGQLRHLLTNNSGQSMAFPGQLMAFSPDGRQLAVIGGGNREWGGGSKVLFYDPETGQLLRTLAGYNDTVGVAFTPDGHSLIAAGGYEAQTWDVHSGQLRQMQASDIPIWSTALSGDGKLMAWGGGKHGYGMVDDSQYLVQMWDLATGQPLYTLQEPGGVVHQVLFSPDGQRLATWNDVNLQVKLLQASTGELLFSRLANYILFHPNGRLFAIDAGDSLQLWDLDTFELVRTVQGLQGPVIFTADGHIVASNDTGSKGLWDIDTGDLLLPFTAGDEGAGLDPRVAALSPDGHILALRNSPPGPGYAGFGTLELWDMGTGHFLWSSAGVVTSVTFSPDGRLLATGNGDGTLSLWGLNPALPASGTCVNDSAYVLDVTVPDGTHFAPAASFTKTWRLHNTGTCTWDPSYRLNFISGDQMNGADSTPLDETVPPGGEVDLSIDLIAPGTNGTYRGQWQLITPDGTPFAVKPYVEIVVP